MEIKKYELQGPIYASQELSVPIFAFPQRLCSTSTRHLVYF